MSFLSGALGTKRLELLRQLVPGAATIGVLVDPYTPEADRERKDVQAAAHAFGQQLIIVEAASEGEIETAFATFAQRRADALFAGTGAFLNSHREQVVALAARHVLPASYALREFATAGGLMSYIPAPGGTPLLQLPGAAWQQDRNGEKSMLRIAVLGLSLIVVGVEAGCAQDIAGIEDCTKTSGLDKRTGCLQSNVNFLQRLVTKNALDARNKLDDAASEIVALKGVVSRLQKTVEQLQAAQKAAGDKKPESK